MADSRLPLQGGRVLDASRVLAGPFCGQVLGDLGAEGSKVERAVPRGCGPGSTFAVQTLSGLMRSTGPVAGPPCKVGVAVTAVLTGLYAAVGVLACLHARQHSGHGYALDLALLDCAVASQVNVA